MLRDKNDNLVILNKQQKQSHIKAGMLELSDQEFIKTMINKYTKDSMRKVNILQE
jgi:hypothetical protein